MNGWVKLRRSLADDPLWTQKPFTEGQALVDLLLHAEFKTHRSGGRKYEAGHVYMSELQLAERWGWSRMKIRHVFKMFERKQYIRIVTKPGRSGGSDILVIGWNPSDKEEPIKQPIKRPVAPRKSGHEEPIKQPYLNTGSPSGENSICENNEEIPSGQPVGLPPEGGAARPGGERDETLAAAFREMWEAMGQDV